jgi:2-dehydro-3-deoxygluconokinase
VLTKGEKGSIIFTRKEKIKIPKVRAKKVIDTIGAGDAYTAGFYAGLARKYDLKKCGILASTTASFVVESKGVNKIPTWEQVLARARRNKLL